MKRLLIGLLALGLLVTFTSPASAKKPTTPTTTPEVQECLFVDQGDLKGTLTGWDGTDKFGYRCQWTVDPNQDFQFEMKGEGAVQIPHLAVTAEYPSGTPVCFNEWETGKQPLPYSFSEFNLGGCGDDNVFALSVSGTIRGGYVQLIWTNMP